MVGSPWFALTASHPTSLAPREPLGKSKLREQEGGLFLQLQEQSTQGYKLHFASSPPVMMNGWTWFNSPFREQNLP